MKATIKIRKEVEIKTLHVEAAVRYWEDAEVNNEPDTEDGEYIPCKEGELWKPIIDVETGVITNWKNGIKAKIHYKVCDAGSYFLKDADGETVLSIDENYVPKILSPGGNGYGDYIIMDVDANGQIANWQQTLDGFESEDD